MGIATKKTDGNVVIIPAIADTLVGDVIEFNTGSIGVAQVEALAGFDISVDTRGVFELPADTAEAFVVGDSVNWDSATDTCLALGSVVAGTVIVGKLATVAGTIQVKIG